MAASPEYGAVAEKVSESTNRQKLETLSAEAADLATTMSQRGDTEGSFYARGLRDAYAIAAAFWSGPEVQS